MKEQYVGDVNDFRKYALLRVLAQTGRLRVGVQWMLTPPDGRPDGSKVDYLQQPDRWRSYDPVLFDLLHRLVHLDGTRAIQHIEAAGIIPDAIYIKDILPDAAQARADAFRLAADRFRDTDLVFFDPDNGLDVPSIPRGRKGSSKYVYRDEVAATFAAGHSVLLYQHFPYKERRAFTAGLGQELAELTGCASAWAFVTPHVLFLLLPRPEHIACLRDGGNEAMSWDGTFMQTMEIGREVKS